MLPFTLRTPIQHVESLISGVKKTAFGHARYSMDTKKMITFYFDARRDTFHNKKGSLKVTYNESEKDFEKKYKAENTRNV